MEQLLLNADLGEGMRNDKQLMPYLSYVNIACGGHFGTSETVLKTIRLAKANRVKVGAHPSYVDPENFGRKSMQISREALALDLKNQIDLFISQCKQAEMSMHHIKLHGALYNDVFSSKEFTKWFFNFVDTYYPNTIVFVPLMAQPFITDSYKVSVLVEAFADRNYNNDLSLVSRSNPKAILGSVKKVVAHVESISKGTIVTLTGESKPCVADTLCIHGDHSLALEIIQAINKLKI